MMKWLVGVFVVLLIFLGVVTYRSTNQVVDGVIVDKTFVPSSTTVGYGGKSTKIYTSAEQYILLVQTDVRSGSFSTDSSTYVQVKVGQHVHVTINSVWGIVGVQP
jgi:predicted small integral membrane protein